MRVVSGTARGCKLQPVPGMNTRPTTDRVKENVFNLIQDHVRGAEVLDLFAGTGQLGIEALSRGAAHCDFVEHNTKSKQVIASAYDFLNIKHSPFEYSAISSAGLISNELLKHSRASSNKSYSIKILPT